MCLKRSQDLKNSRINGSWIESQESCSADIVGASMSKALSQKDSHF